MDIPHKLYLIKIKFSESLHTRGSYYFYPHDKDSIINLVRSVLDKELNYIKDTWTGCDGCKWCCYGEILDEEWCEIKSKNPPSSFQDWNDNYLSRWGRDSEFIQIVIYKIYISNPNVSLLESNDNEELLWNYHSDMELSSLEKVFQE